MFTKVEKIELSQDKKRLLLNFIYSGVIQGANYLLPFLTLPYLIHTLGTEKYGLIAFAQAFNQYFIILTDFGFNLSATREVALYREDIQKLSEIYCSVMFAKILFMCLSFSILMLVVFSFSKFRHDWLLYIITFGMVVGNLIFPIWFFLGMEKMKYATFLNIVAKSFFTVCIFIFIRKQADFIFVPLINSLGFIIAGILAIFIILKDFKIKLFIPKFRTILQSLIDSSQFFITKVSTLVFTASNSFILGIFTNNQMVGYYATAEKLYVALQGVYYPLTDNLYPYMSKQRNKSLFIKIFFLAVTLNALLCFCIYTWSNDITRLIFGGGLEVTAHVLRIFSIIMIFSVPSILLGYPLLGAFGRARQVNISIIIGSLIHLTGLACLAYFSRINPYSIALMVLATEMIILTLKVCFILMRK